MLRIHADDNVCVALQSLSAGTEVSCGDLRVLVREDIRLGAKLALRPLRKGDLVLKYGEPIGTLTEAVPRGGHIHSHNLRSNYIS